MLGLNTDVINGQRVPEMSNSGWKPLAYGPVHIPSGAAIAPTVPPMVGQYGGIASGMTGVSSVAAEEAGKEPFSFAKSPLPWALTFLVVGLLGLKFVHWRSMAS